MFKYQDYYQSNYSSLSNQYQDICSVILRQQQMANNAYDNDKSSSDRTAPTITISQHHCNRPPTKINDLRTMVVAEAPPQRRRAANKRTIQCTITEEPELLVKWPYKQAAVSNTSKQPISNDFINIVSDRASSCFEKTTKIWNNIEETLLKTATRAIVFYTNTTIDFCNIMPKLVNSRCQLVKRPKRNSFISILQFLHQLGGCISQIHLWVLLFGLLVNAGNTTSSYNSSLSFSSNHYSSPKPSWHMNGTTAAIANKLTEFSTVKPHKSPTLPQAQKPLAPVAPRTAAVLFAGTATLEPASEEPSALKVSALTHKSRPLKTSSTSINTTTTANGIAVCSISQFTCNNGRCISLNKYCNNVNDCLDSSDEPRFCSRKFTTNKQHINTNKEPYILLLL